MPCRALEAFGLLGGGGAAPPPGWGLNALSGIGGVRTTLPTIQKWWMRRRVLMPCRALEAFGLIEYVAIIGLVAIGLNALSGIGGVRTKFANLAYPLSSICLNALSGIGGVRTPLWHPDPP